MAAPVYGIRYKGGWKSIDGLMQGYVYIDQIDYEDEFVTNLLLSFDSVAIRYSFGDWNNPIIGLNCEFVIENNKSDFFELLPLLTAEESEYRVRIEVELPTSYQLFEGFLNVDTISHKYLKYQNIKFAASCYLSKLDNFHPDSIDELKDMNFITIIQEILKYTGKFHNIRINSKLHAQGDILLSTQTLFSKNGFHTELFQENEVDRSSCLKILTAILTSFDCYIYWFNSVWYIERYEDIWNTSVNFVEYDIDSNYINTNSEGTVVQELKDIKDVHDLQFIEQSQTLSINPGIQTIKINLNDERLTNLTKADLKGIEEIPIMGLLNPSLRAWQCKTNADISWVADDAGKPIKTIVNSIHRILATTEYTGDLDLIATSFKVTIDNENTNLNVKFKYIVNPDTILDWKDLTWKDITFHFNWMLMDHDTASFYIFQSGDVWKMMIPTFSTMMIQQQPVSGTEFDPINGSCDVSISIPLGKVHKIVDNVDEGLLPFGKDMNLTFIFGLEGIAIDSTEYRTYALQAWYGDFVIDTSGDNQDNVITGKVNSKFLNKKEIALSLYDCKSCNYKNAILRSSDLTVRTERWGVDTGATNIIAKGVCWKTSTGPTIANDKTIDGTGIEEFTSYLTRLSPGTTYYVRAYYTNGEGNTYYGDEKTFTTLNLQVGTYFEGGMIGYIFQPSDYGYVNGYVHGIVVAPHDIPGGDFWCSLATHPYSAAANSTDIGYGKINTDLMMAMDSNVNEYAAKKCTDYQNGGFSDWFLGSRGDMIALQTNKDVIKGFEPHEYWTSSEEVIGGGLSTAGKYASVVDFSKVAGASYAWSTIKKNNTRNVRPIRYF